MSNAIIHAERQFTPTHGLVVHQVGIVLGIPTSRQGKFSFLPGKIIFSLHNYLTHFSLCSLQSHCLSEMHQPNNFEIYRTTKECCEAHFPSSFTCLQDSKDSHDPFPWPIHFPGSPEHRPFAPPVADDHWGTEARARWFPDLINKLNCVRGRNYENWMQTDGFEAYYLFENSEDCCEKW